MATIVTPPSSIKVQVGNQQGPKVTTTGATSTDTLAREIATSSFGQANSAFDKANSANTLAQSAYNAANSAGSSANVVAAFIQANAAFIQANASFLQANTPSYVANSAGVYANGAFAQANSANTLAQAAYNAANAAGSSANVVAAFLQANAAFIKANSANVLAQAAFDNSNTKFNTSGGTINGSITITQDASILGNLYILGNTTSINTSSFTVQDSLLTLGVGNYTTDLLDIGFSSHYNAGVNAHTGLIRDAGTKEWMFFEGYTPEVSPNNNIIITDPSFRYANVTANNFKGNVIANNVTINGYNVFSYITNAYTQANNEPIGTAAFNNSNTKFSSSGGTITGNTIITGNLTTDTSTIANSNSVFSRYGSGVYGWENSGITANLVSIMGEGTSTGLFFKPDGTRMYVCGQSTDRIVEFYLSTPWNISTAANVGSISILSQDTSSVDVSFKPDGTTMYMLGDTSNSIFQYTLSTPWQANTAVYASKANNIALATGNAETSPAGMWFKPDGTTVYVVGTTTALTRKFDLGTPWDISTLTNPNITASVPGTPAGISFEPDGSRYYVIASNSDWINQYNLSVPWDITTDGGSPAETRYIGNEENTGHYLFVSSANSVAYFGGTTTDKIYQYYTNNGFKLKSNTFTVDADTTFSKQVFFDSQDGSDAMVFRSARSLGTTTFTTGSWSSTGLTATSTVTFSGTTSTISFTTSATTGTITAGGPSQTGTIILGQSAVTQTTNVHSGATTSGNIKTLNLGVGGLSGSNTLIFIGSANSGSQGTTTIQTPNVIVTSANTAQSVVQILGTSAAISNSTGALIVAGGIGSNGAIYTTGGSITINNGLVTTGNSGTIFLGDGAFTKTYGSGWTFPGSGVTSGTFTGTATGSAPNFQGQLGSNTTVSHGLVGTAGVGMYFPTNGLVGLAANSSNALFVSAPAGGVNYLQVTGSNTGNAVIFSAQGTDTNISQVLQPKGTGAIDLAAGSSGVNISNGGTVTAITKTSLGNNYTSPPALAISAPTTAGGVTATATTTLQLGSVTGIVISGGSGYAVGDDFYLVGGTYTTQMRLRVATLSGSAVATVTSVNGGEYTVIPSTGASTTAITGAGSGCTITPVWALGNTITITNAGSGYVEQPTVTFSGGGGSGAAAYATVGSGTVVKSIGSTMSFYTPGGEQFRINDTYGGSGTAANYITAAGRSAGAGPVLSVGGSDPNIVLNLVSKGTSGVAIGTNNGAQQQFNISHTASAVNYGQVTGGATGTGPTFSAQGSDTNADLNLAAKNTGKVVLAYNSGQSGLGFANATSVIASYTYYNQGSNSMDTVFA